MAAMRIEVVDSHTGGEPTRLVLNGGPELHGGTLRERLKDFRERFDHVRSAIVNEPRGSDAIVGALLCEPLDASCQTGVIFFNNVGFLGMCGHGTIGLVATMRHLGKIEAGEIRIETPVGVVSAQLDESGAVTLRNVPSYRHAKDVTIILQNGAKVTGDVAWGGNWFYQVKGESGYNLSLSNLSELTLLAGEIRESVEHAGVTGRDGAPIDHIELFSAPRDARADSRNFILCPGGSYDRSPCGTGTSAKMACLYSDGKLKPGDTWVQESITGSIFEGRIELVNGEIIPFIRGSAFVTAKSELLIEEDDPFCWGIPTASAPSAQSARARPC